jgi:hypothetical protein
MPTDYDEIKSAIEQAGYFAFYEAVPEYGDRLICASDRWQNGPNQGDFHGNSFWVARRGNHWFIATWGPCYYRMTEPKRSGELCISLLSRQPERAYSMIDKEVQLEFGLIEIDETELPG